MNGARVLHPTLLVGGRCLLIGGVASQPERPQTRSLFPHREQFGLVLGHRLPALTQRVLLPEKSFGATMRLIQIGTQYRNSWIRPQRKSRVCSPENRVYLG